VSGEDEIGNHLVLFPGGRWTCLEQSAGGLSVRVASCYKGGLSDGSLEGGFMSIRAKL
jgi:hypothetical protein